MREPNRLRRKANRSGQATLEFVIAFLGVVLPVIFAIIFTSELLWMWHSVNEFTRQGASYASTHCWTNSGSNVANFMRTNAPPVVGRDQLQNGPATIAVSYYAHDPDSGQLTAFECDTECSTSCIPDTVTVSVTGFEFRTFITSLGLPPVQIPDFRTSMAMEGAGCDPEQGVCVP